MTCLLCILAADEYKGHIHPHVQISSLSYSNACLKGVASKQGRVIFPTFQSSKLKGKGYSASVKS